MLSCEEWVLGLGCKSSIKKARLSIKSAKSSIKFEFDDLVTRQSPKAKPSAIDD